MEQGAYHPHHQRYRSDNGRPLNLPKGDSSYARGKRAEYIQKDLELAKLFYMEAIRENDRLESAVKDITSILHQQHRTREACEFLEKYENFFTDPVKYKNLHSTLSRQINATGNSQNKTLKVSPVLPETTPSDIRGLFFKPGRIQEVVILQDFALIYFTSHSAARKTLESFRAWERFKVEWLNNFGVTQGEARQGHTMLKPNKANECDEENLEVPELIRDPSENTAVLLLGKSLYDEI